MTRQQFRVLGYICGYVTVRVSLGTIMDGVKPTGLAGLRLKQLREHLGLTLRQVEAHSRQLAGEKQNQDFFISRGWLNNVENGSYTPSIFKLYAIGAIYGTHWSSIFQYFGLNLSDFGRDQARFAPPKTQLVIDSGKTGSETIAVPAGTHENFNLDKTSLLSRLEQIWGTVPSRVLQHLESKNSVYGVIGASDFTMYPLLRPGSIVQIDENQRKPSQVKWKDEHDRPIYFIELRGQFICSWCEIRDGLLLAVPYPSSKSEIRRFMHPREAEIVGRVTSVAMHLGGPQP